MPCCSSSDGETVRGEGGEAWRWTWAGGKGVGEPGGGIAEGVWSEEGGSTGVEVEEEEEWWTVVGSSQGED